MRRDNVTDLARYRATRSHGTPRTPAAAARELAADGHSEVESGRIVEQYLDDVAELLGDSPEGWPLDDTDLSEMRTAAAVERARHALAALPEQQTATQLAFWPAAVPQAADAAQDTLW